MLNVYFFKNPPILIHVLCLIVGWIIGKIWKNSGNIIKLLQASWNTVVQTAGPYIDGNNVVGSVLTPCLVYESVRSGLTLFKLIFHFIVKLSHWTTNFLNNRIHMTGAKFDPGPWASMPLFAIWIFSTHGPTLGGGFTFFLADFFFFLPFLPRVLSDFPALL
jgi:hypothetical protein